MEEYDKPLSTLTNYEIAQKIAELVENKQVDSPAYNALIVEMEKREERDKQIVSDYYRPEDTPLKNLVNFTDFKDIFINSHQHLGQIFGLLEEELGLWGNSYYDIKKALCYWIESLRQPTLSFFIGSVACDNRIHMACMLKAGSGKGQIKNAVRQYKQSKYDDVVIFPAVRLNIEQLIGRIIVENIKNEGDKKSHKETKVEKGYLGYKGVIVDECQDLLNENERTYEATMIEFRGAMEVWHKNTVHKKLTADELISYDPESRFLFLLHPNTFPTSFFDRGTSRRLFVFSADSEPIPIEAAWAGLFAQPARNVFKDYLNAVRPDGPLGTFLEYPRELNFVEDSLNELKEWIEAWVRFTLTHPNLRIRALGQSNFKNIKDTFIRMCAILALKNNEPKPSIPTIKWACFDTIHFLMRTYEIYANNGSLNLSKDVWQTDNVQEAMVFEWMWHNNARSEDSTKLTIYQVQEMIADTVGVQDRQARAIFSRLVERGLIGRSKGQHTSKAWLAFIPTLEGGVALDSVQPIDLKDFISKKMEVIKNNQSGESCSKIEPFKNARVTRNIDRNNNNNYDNLIEPDKITAPNATLENKNTSTEVPLYSKNMENNGYKKPTKSDIQDALNLLPYGKEVLLGHDFEFAPPELQEALKLLARAGDIFEPRADIWMRKSIEEVPTE